MIVFEINEIIEEDNVIHGIVDFKNLAIDIYRITYGQEKTDSLEELLELTELVDENNQSFFFIKRFYQYVGVIEFTGETMLKLTLSDFKNDISAVHQYLKEVSTDWDQKDRDTYIEVFQEILSDPELENAKLYALNIF